MRVPNKKHMYERAQGGMNGRGTVRTSAGTVIDAPLKHPHPMQHFVIYRIGCSISCQSFVQTKFNIPLVYTPDYKYVF